MKAKTTVLAMGLIESATALMQRTAHTTGSRFPPGILPFTAVITRINTKSKALTTSRGVTRASVSITLPYKTTPASASTADRIES